MSDPSGPDIPRPSRMSLLAHVGELWASLTGWGGRLFELMSLETRQAVRALALMLAAALVAILLGVTAWFTAVAGILLWVVRAGVSWPLALTLAAVLNLAVAGLLLYGVKRSSRKLLFTATRRQLRPNAAADRVTAGGVQHP
jgi:uncharacterized membrane protein YqjE